MRRRACRHEPEVALALREDRWTPELAAHAEACASCREAARVATWLQAVARSAVTGAAPPDAARVWKRAGLARQVLRRQELARRAARPALWFQRTAAVAAGAATVAWIYMSRSYLGETTGSLLDGGWWRRTDGSWPAGLEDPWSLALLAGTLLVLALLGGRAALDRLERP